MMMFLWSTLLLLGSVVVTAQRPSCLCVEEVAQLDSPTVIVAAHDGTDRFYAATQHGVVYIYERNGDGGWNQLSEEFLDLADVVRVNPGYDEQGFLGLEFHPKYAENGRLFLYYSVTHGRDQHYTRVSELLRNSTDPNKADPNTERILLEVEQSSSNNNGGTFMWAYPMFPEAEQLDKLGYLFLTVGDGGGIGDPGDNGQDTSSILGNLLLIDVDNFDEGQEYGIPDENPFIGNQELGAEEIFALGFRNPWKCSIDAQSQRMFLGDVGKNRVEEIDILDLSHAGHNYGWAVYEGTECYSRDSRCGTIPEETLEWPIFEYTHRPQAGSVTGGYVYRGSDNPAMEGLYVFADWVKGTLETLDEVDGSWNHDLITMCSDCSARNSNWTNSYANYIQAFGVDEEDELYFGSKVNKNSDGDGFIYKLIDPENN